MSLPTIPEGLTVKYQHRRNCTRPVKMGDYSALDPRGGETVASVFDTDGNLVASGVACCHAKDNYSKRIGRAIALGRALKAYRELADDLWGQDENVRSGDGTRKGEAA